MYLPNRSLQKHMNKIHLRIRPVICEVCGDSFGDIHNLRAHISYKHTIDKLFKCNHCPYESNGKVQFAGR